MAGHFVPAEVVVGLVVSAETGCEEMGDIGI